MQMFIFDREGKKILDILTNQNDDIFWDAIYRRTLTNQESLNFKTIPGGRATEYLRDQNRVVIQGDDGFFREFIIISTVQQRNVLEVYTVGSQLEIAFDAPISPIILDGQTVNTATDYALQNSRWKRGITEYSGTREINIEEHKTPLAVLNRIAADFNVEIRFRVEREGSEIKHRYVDFLEKRGAWRGREIVSGKDLINISNTRDNSEIATALKGLSPPKEDGTQLEVTVTNEEARQIWGIEGNHRWQLYEPVSDNQDMTLAQLQSYTEIELNKRIASVIEYQIDAVDLEYVFGRSHEMIRLGDQVRIKADDYNPPIYLDSRVVEVEYDITAPSKKKFVLGETTEYSVEEINAIKNQLLRKIATKANKNLYGPDGEPIGELGEQTNVPDLYAGNFYSPAVPAQSTQDMTFFVSDRVIDVGAVPSDNNDGDGWSSPLRTVAEALRRIPKQLDHQAKILLAYGGEYLEYIRVDGISGGGKLIIDGQGKTQTKLRNGITVLGTYLDVLVEELTIIAESTFEVFSANAGNIKLDQCVVKGNETLGTRHGVYSYKSCNMVVTNSNIYGVENCLNTDQNGSILQINNNGHGSKYGLRAVSGRITGYGTAPGGDIANYYKSDGGVLEPNDFTFSTQTNPDPPEITTITKQWSATDSDAYSYGQFPGWKVGSSDLLQGSYGSYGPYKSAWIFGGAPSSEVTGKTIKQIRIISKRLSGSGAGTYVPIHFRPHGYTSKPSGAPSLSGDVYKREFKPGEEKPVTLPSSYHAGFENGTYKGIGIYSGSGDYARMAPEATLEITYEG